VASSDYTYIHWKLVYLKFDKVSSFIEFHCYINFKLSLSLVSDIFLDVTPQADEGGEWSPVHKARQ